MIEKLASSIALSRKTVELAKRFNNWGVDDLEQQMVIAASNSNVIVSDDFFSRDLTNTELEDTQILVDLFCLGKEDANKLSSELLAISHGFWE